MSWYNPRTWRQEAPGKSLFMQAKDRSWNEIIQLMYSHQVASGESVTPANAMRCTTVHAIVRALTNAIGSYPIGVFKELRDDDGKTTFSPLPNHELNKLLRQPNRRMATTQYFRRVMTHLALWGNHISIKARGRTGPVIFLRPVHPDIVTVINDDETNPVFEVRFTDGVRQYNQFQVIHITGGISIDGAWAQSPVEDAAEAIGLCLAAERLLAELYGGSGIPSVALTGGKFSSEEQYEIWINKWKAAYGRGGTQSGGTALLPEGMDIKEMQFKPVDAQLLEARKFQRTEIASVWGVPPHKLADLERSTFSNIEHQGLEFLQDVMLPYARLIEQALERDLLTNEDKAAGVVIRFDLDSAERADFKSRVEGYSKMHAVGAMNPNEIRSREGMNPRDDEDGDAYATPLNMRTSSDPDADSEDADGDGEGDAGSDDEDASLRAV
jgi:HK97 family phage portal protein